MAAAPVNTTFAQDWTSLFQCRELLLSRISSFNDRPEYIVTWKTIFKDIVDELGLSPRKEIDLLIKWLDAERKTGNKSENLQCKKS